MNEQVNQRFDPSDPARPASPLFVSWERQTRFWALIFAALACGVTILVVVALMTANHLPGTFFVMAPVVASLVYRWQTARIRRRRTIMQEPFPAEWETVLQRDVVFFRVLNPPEQERFRRQLQVFLGEKRITGIQTRLDATTRVLAAASAVIPIFGFPDWEWDQINEVLIYPNRFDDNFQVGDTRGQNILGMVGTGSLNRLMILSKPDLITGFRNATDKHNVGIHEFAHLVDKADGRIDGVPGISLDRQAVGPWVDLMRRKMTEIESGKSDINRYALTNEAEFFAVTAEYFFERPGIMRQKHPQLYAALEQVFAQNFRARADKLRQALTRKRQKFGRNSPCPCGSGKKFKQCCLS